MEYIIIAAQSHQYLLKPNDTFVVNGTVDSKSLDQLISVLAVKNSTFEVGQPSLDTKLTFEIVGETKSPKIKVNTYRSKSRYRRKKGHRQAQTIIKFVVSQKEKQTKVAKKTKAKPAATPKSTKTTKNAKPPKKATRTSA